MRAPMEAMQRETTRLQLQADFDRQQGSDARNRQGQFATPPELARAITSYVTSLLPDAVSRDQPLHFLEPAFGSGSFLSALKASLNERPIEARGVEIDENIARIARRVWRNNSLRLRRADFTRLRPPPPGARADLIITNPPYVRHHHLGAEAKSRLSSEVRRRLKMSVNGLAGLYCYYLLLAHDWLADEGWAAWLIPSEFMDANYGQCVREYLTTRVAARRIHWFDPSGGEFSDAAVTSALVVFQKRSPPPDLRIELSSGDSPTAPDELKSLPLDELASRHRWSAPFRAKAPARKSRRLFGDLFEVRRGLATGCNKFFILERAEADRAGVPAACQKPILPSPRRLRERIIRADEQGHPCLDRQLVLIDCPWEEAELRRRRRLWEYFEDGVRRGVNRGYLLRKRSPWYSQEVRDPAPFVCTYMGRPRGGQPPIRFFWNQSRATAANVFLLVYPKAPLRELIGDDQSREARLFAALRRLEEPIAEYCSRLYGGGLHKIEPSQLKELPADELWAALR